MGTLSGTVCFLFLIKRVHCQKAFLWQTPLSTSVRDQIDKHILRVGQNRIYTPYMTVYLMISLPKLPYIHRIYIWFWPTLHILVGLTGYECTYAHMRTKIPHVRHRV